MRPAVLTEAGPILLASYPRSGNTLLRTILWHCFGLRSASRYQNDLGGDRELEEIVGHIEWDADNRIRFPKGNIPLFKTHLRNEEQHPAIYVVRDGRPATVSFWRFFQEDFNYSLSEVIEGRRHPFGTWTEHIGSWDPWNRPDTLLLRYEDMVEDLPMALQAISRFIKRDIECDTIPSRQSIAGQTKRFVNKKSDWREHLHGDLLKRFLEINEETLRKAGYVN